MIKSIEIKNQEYGEYFSIARDDSGNIEVRVRGPNEIYGDMDSVSVTLNKTQAAKLVEHLSNLLGKK